MNGTGTVKNLANVDAKWDTMAKTAINVTHIQAVSMVIVEDHGNVTASEQLFSVQNKLVRF